MSVILPIIELNVPIIAAVTVASVMLNPLSPLISFALLFWRIMRLTCYWGFAGLIKLFR